MWGGGIFLYYSYVCGMKTMSFESTHENDLPWFLSIYPSFLLNLGPLWPVPCTLLVACVSLWIKLNNTWYSSGGAYSFAKQTLAGVPGLWWSCTPRKVHGQQVSLWRCPTLCLLTYGTWQMECLSSTTVIPEVWQLLIWFYSLQAPLIFLLHFLWTRSVQATCQVDHGNEPWSQMPLIYGTLTNYQSWW